MLYDQKAAGYAQKAAPFRRSHGLEHLFQAVGTLFWRRQSMGLEALFQLRCRISASASAGSWRNKGFQPLVRQVVRRQVQEVQDFFVFTILVLSFRAEWMPQACCQ